ncbi:MAG TPA: hypothetical protein VF178_15485 [Gemmatimonadaceae bacterium]
MLNALSLAALGFLLGVRHAVDPDHVVAVGTIATREPSVRRALAIGALWGLGHTITILLAGGAIITLRLTISPRVGLALEFGVALMLILLGIVNLAGARRTPAPSTARPLLVGMVHGLAGSAAVALLVLAAVREPAWGFAYLGLFGAGTIAGMMAVTALIAVPAALAVARLAAARQWLAWASGLASVAFGVLLAHDLSGPGGLFSANPMWTPH